MEYELVGIGKVSLVGGIKRTPARSSHRGNSTEHRLNFRCKYT